DPDLGVLVDIPEVLGRPQPKSSLDWPVQRPIGQQMPASRPSVGAADERTVRDAFRRLTAGARDRVHTDPASPRATHSWLLDMDGVLAREEHAIPGADRFLS